MKPHLLLGSSSPRRKQLLKNFFTLEVISPDIDERQKKNEAPRAYVQRVARAKFAAVVKHARNEKAILCADTIVEQEGKILGKAKHKVEAAKILKLLSGKTHRVITTIVVGKKTKQRWKIKSQTVVTRIRFRILSAEEIASYVRSRHWQGKAGAYAIQGPASGFVSAIHGSLTNVIGLPLEESLHLLRSL